MNRQKKIAKILKKRIKQARAKTQPNNPNKPRYIAKADRAALDAEASSSVTATSQTSNETPATEPTAEEASPK